MQRRTILKFLGAAAGVWATQRDAGGLLQTAAASPRGPLPPVRLAAAQRNALSEPLLPLFPLPLVLFPHMDLPLHIFEERYKEMIHDCLENRWEFGILLAREESAAERIGCTASVTEVVRKYPDGRMDILVRGQRRFELSQPNQEKPYSRGRAQFFEDEASEQAPEELRQQALDLYERLARWIELADPSLKKPSPTITDAQLSFQIMAGIPAELDWKQQLLELRSEPERLARTVVYLQDLLDYLERSPDQQTPSGKA